MSGKWCIFLNSFYFSILDEVGAIVLDFGSHSLRGGLAGEDTPKVNLQIIAVLFVDRYS